MLTKDSIETKKAQFHKVMFGRLTRIYSGHAVQINFHEILDKLRAVENAKDAEIMGAIDVTLDIIKAVGVTAAPLSMGASLSLSIFSLLMKGIDKLYALKSRWQALNFKSNLIKALVFMWLLKMAANKKGVSVDACSEDDIIKPVFDILIERLYVRHFFLISLLNEPVIIILAKYLADHFEKNITFDITGLKVKDEVFNVYDSESIIKDFFNAMSPKKVGRFSKGPSITIRDKHKFYLGYHFFRDLAFLTSRLRKSYRSAWKHYRFKMKCPRVTPLMSITYFPERLASDKYRVLAYNSQEAQQAPCFLAAICESAMGVKMLTPGEKKVLHESCLDAIESYMNAETKYFSARSQATSYAHTPAKNIRYIAGDMPIEVRHFAAPVRFPGMDKVRITDPELPTVEDDRDEVDIPDIDSPELDDATIYDLSLVELEACIKYYAQQAIVPCGNLVGKLQLAKSKRLKGGNYKQQLKNYRASVLAFQVEAEKLIVSRKSGKLEFPMFTRVFALLDIQFNQLVVLQRKLEKSYKDLTPLVTDEIGIPFIPPEPLIKLLPSTPSAYPFSLRLGPLYVGIAQDKALKESMNRLVNYLWSKTNLPISCDLHKEQT